jgi:hypothetical protein
VTEAYNAADPRDLREAAKQSKIAETQRKEIMIGLMSLPAGRQWMHELLVRCHVFSCSFNGNALQSAFAEGERNIGLALLIDVMNACPDQYVMMEKEANGRSSGSEFARRQSRQRRDSGREDDENGADGNGADEA